MRTNWILSVAALLGLVGSTALAGSSAYGDDHWPLGADYSGQDNWSMVSHWGNSPDWAETPVIAPRPLPLSDYSLAMHSVEQTSHAAEPVYQDSAYEATCRPPVWVIGTEVTFLSPQFHGDGNTGISYENTGIADSLAQLSGPDAFDGFTYAPRIFLGKQGEKWGVMTRFWYLSDSNGTALPSDTPGEPAVIASERAKAFTIDLELTRQFLRCNGGRTVLSLGVRHAEMESGGAFSTSIVLDDEVISAFASSSSTFRGTGLTFGGWDTRPLHPCCNWYLFTGGRGSVLWGDDTARASSGTTVGSDGGAFGASFDSAIASSDEAVFIGEITAGLQWERRLECFPATAFVRVAGEFQWWHGSGDAVAFTESNAGAGTSTALATATATGTDMTLAGFSVGTGLIW
ncbi:MAG: hypothetical protein WDZ51_18880 [Pirellulaceae bacterium]